MLCRGGGRGRKVPSPPGEAPQPVSEAAPHGAEAALGRAAARRSQAGPGPGRGEARGCPATCRQQGRRARLRLGVRRGGSAHGPA